MPSLRSAGLLVSFLAALVSACGVAEGEHAVVTVRDPDSGAKVELLQFGEVEAGERTARRVFILNEGPGDVVFESIAWAREPSPHFSYTLEPALPAKALKPWESVQLVAHFTPQGSGASVATLAIRVRDARGERVEHLALEGTGLPPEGLDRHQAVMNAPAHFDLGRVPFVEALGERGQAAKSRVLHVINAGGVDSRFSLDAVTVEALDEGTQRDELTVVPRSWDAGIRAGDLLPVLLTVTPASLGAKTWRVTFHAREDEVAPLVVHLTAEVAVPGHCRLYVPESLDLGVVSPPKPRSGELVLRNLGQSPDEACVVWGFHLEPTPSGFEVVDADDAILLEAGQERAVTVKTRPLPQGTFEATLRFRTTSAERPLVAVPVVVRVPRESCLVISPDELDFGTASTGCNAQAQSFHLYNACSEPFSLRGYRMAAPAGQPAGGPDCAGTQPCPEFTLMQAPPVPPGGLVLQPGAPPLTFFVRYRPIDFGSDTGAVALELDVGEGEPPITYVVGLKGRADSFGETLDAFTQHTPSKLDLLLVLDSSPAMTAHEANTARNLQGIAAALGDPWRFDARVAVVTGDPADGLGFRTGPLHPAPVLGSGMTDFVAQFAQKVDVGRMGSSAQSCLGRAADVLSAPQNAGEGLLRPGVPLTVVCLFGAPDSSGGTAEDHVTALLTASGKTPATLSVTALGPVGPQCGGDTGLFAELSSSPFAYVDEICTADIRPQPGPFYSVRSRFPLTSVPRSANAITVYVEGVPTPPVLSDGSTVWTYDAVGIAVVFEPQHVPLPGATVEIHYPLSCH